MTPTASSAREDGDRASAGILTLTTDFGADGPYVAAMKGVVLGLAPGTQTRGRQPRDRPPEHRGGGVRPGRDRRRLPGRDGPPGRGRPRGRDRPPADRGRGRRPVVRPARQRPDRRRAPGPRPLGGLGDHATRDSGGRSSRRPSTAATSSPRPPPTCSSAATRPNSGRRSTGSSSPRRSSPSRTPTGCVGEVIFLDSFGNLDHQHPARPARLGPAPRLVGRDPGDGSTAWSGPTPTARRARWSP